MSLSLLSEMSPTTSLSHSRITPRQLNVPGLRRLCHTRRCKGNGRRSWHVMARYHLMESRYTLKRQSVWTLAQWWQLCFGFCSIGSQKGKVLKDGVSRIEGNETPCEFGTPSALAERKKLSLSWSQEEKCTSPLIQTNPIEFKF